VSNRRPHRRVGSATITGVSALAAAALAQVVSGAPAFAAVSPASTSGPATAGGPLQTSPPADPSGSPSASPSAPASSSSPAAPSTSPTSAAPSPSATGSTSPPASASASPSASATSPAPARHSGAGPKTEQTTSTPTPTDTESTGCFIWPNYGCGKIQVEATPKLSTFPGGQAPSLEGLDFEIDGFWNAGEEDLVRTSAASDTPPGTEPGTDTCSTDTADPDDAQSWDCPVSTGPSDGGEGPWAAGTPFTVTLDGAAPENTIIPDVTGSMPDCTPEDDVPLDNETCGNTKVTVYGAYRDVVFTVTNSATGAPVPGSDWILCGQAQSQSSPTPTPTDTQTEGDARSMAAADSGSCPSGESQLAQGTTAENGTIDFGLFPEGDYDVVPTSVPNGYEDGSTQSVTVPVVSTAADSGKAFDVAAQLDPKPPIVPNVEVSTSEDTPVTFNALAGATPVTSPLTITNVGSPSNGTAHDPVGKITYTPDEDFVGTDSFTFTTRNGLGGTATATVEVAVHRVVPPRSAPPSPTTTSTGVSASTLPFTGEDALRDGAVGLLALTSGGLLMVAGRRRRHGKR